MRRQSVLNFPAPYFGGKAAVANRVWEAIGNVDHYIEPFAGSGAVLLRRPHWTPDKTETINDIDSNLANVWRALQFKPDETARWCDWPVNHDDLRARKKAITENRDYLRDHLIADAEWCNPKLAGYWIWAASCWIGAGLTRPGQRPVLTSKGMGVHKAGQRPHLSHKGMGVHKAGQIPHLSDKGVGVTDPYNENIYAWFRCLSERLRYVRVVCGDWKQVCGGDWQDAKWSTVGMFFDPPYGVEDRIKVYDHDSTEVASDVMAWCIERGARDNYRIVIAGYEEYAELVEQHGWRSETWSAKGGYANLAGAGGDNSRGQQNRHREMMYYSPGCKKKRKVGFIE